MSVRGARRSAKGTAEKNADFPPKRYRPAVDVWNTAKLTGGGPSRHRIAHLLPGLVGVEPDHARHEVQRAVCAPSPRACARPIWRGYSRDGHFHVRQARVPFGGTVLASVAGERPRGPQYRRTTMNEHNQIGAGLTSTLRRRRGHGPSRASRARSEQRTSFNQSTFLPQNGTCF
jgi:hypothetical protein